MTGIPNRQPHGFGAYLKVSNKPPHRPIPLTQEASMHSLVCDFNMRFRASASVVILVLLCLSASASHAEIKVYDADGQYLGIANEAGASSQAIFVPGVGLWVKIAIISSNFGDIPGDIDVNVLQYLQVDCDGDPISFGNYTYIFKGGDGLYYTAVWPPVWRTVQSELDTLDGDCNSGFSPSEKWVFEIKEVQPSEIPFTLPVSLPLRYEYADCCAQSGSGAITTSHSVPTMTAAGIGVMSLLYMAIAVMKLRKKHGLSVRDAIKRALWVE
jgi:hypothetical protein